MPNSAVIYYPGTRAAETVASFNPYNRNNVNLWDLDLKEIGFAKYEYAGKDKFQVVYQGKPFNLDLKTKPDNKYRFGCFPLKKAELYDGATDKFIKDSHDGTYKFNIRLISTTKDGTPAASLANEAEARMLALLNRICEVGNEVLSDEDKGNIMSPGELKSMITYPPLRDEKGAIIKKRKINQPNLEKCPTLDVTAYYNISKSHVKGEPIKPEDKILALKFEKGVRVPGEAWDSQYTVDEMQALRFQVQGRFHFTDVRKGKSNYLIKVQCTHAIVYPEAGSQKDTFADDFADAYDVQGADGDASSPQSHHDE